MCLNNMKLFNRNMYYQGCVTNKFIIGMQFILRHTRIKRALWLGCNKWLHFLQIFARNTENPCLTSNSESSWQQCSFGTKRGLASMEQQLDKKCQSLPNLNFTVCSKFKPCGSKVTWGNCFKRYYTLQNNKAWILLQISHS